MAVSLVMCQVLIAAVFAVSAFTKLRNGVALREFAGSLTMLPAHRRRPVAVTVACAELAVPALMLIPLVGFALSGVLLAGFSLVIGMSMGTGEQMTCRCFGTSSTPLGPVHLIRNGILALVVVTGLVCLRAPAEELSAAGLAVAVPTGLVAAVLLIVFDDIAGLFVDNSERA